MRWLLRKYNWNVPLFFVIAASILQLLYGLHFSTLKNYAHGPQRFFYITHLAYTVTGQPDSLPTSMLETLARVNPWALSRVSLIRCKLWLPNDTHYCDPHLVAHDNAFAQLAAIALHPESRFAYHPHQEAAHLPILGYLPYAAGALLAILLHLPPIIILICALTANATLIIALGYYTLRALPVLRWPVCYLLLSPMAVMLRGFIMPDALALDLCCLFTALTLRAKYNETILSGRDKAQLVILSALVGFVKIFYCAVPLLLLILPSVSFGGRPRKAGFIALAIAISITASGAWGWYAAQQYYSDKSINDTPIHSVDAFKKQIAFVVSSPLTYVRTLDWAFMRSFANVRGMDSIFTGCIPPSALKAFFMLFPLLIIPLFASEPLQQRRLYSPRDRVLVFMIFLSSVLIVYTIKFIFENWPLDESAKNGFKVLPRYLLPILIFLPLSWQALWVLRGRWEQRLRNPLIGMLLLALFYMHYSQLGTTFSIF